MRPRRKDFRAPIHLSPATEGIRHHQREKLSRALTPPHGLFPSHSPTPIGTPSCCNGPSAPDRVLLVLINGPVGLCHHEQSRPGAEGQPAGRLRKGNNLILLPGKHELDYPPHQHQHQHTVGNLRMLCSKIEGQRRGKKQPAQEGGIAKRVHEREKKVGGKRQGNKFGVMPCPQDDGKICRKAERKRR